MEKNDPARKQLELNSLIEFSQLISSKLDLKYILDNILLSTMGKLLISKGIVLIRSDQTADGNAFIVEAVKGLDQSLLGQSMPVNFPKLPVFNMEDFETDEGFFSESSLNYFFKIYFQNKLLGVLCLGRKLSNTPLTNSEIVSIETMLNISASAIENTIRFNEVRSLNSDLNNKVRQLRSLFELSKEFNSNIIDKESIIKLLSFTLLGNFGIRDFIIYSRDSSNNFVLVKDNRKPADFNPDPEEAFPYGTTMAERKKTVRIAESVECTFFRMLGEAGYELVIPTVINGEVEDIICLGGKLSKLPYSDSDIEFLESIMNISLISIRNSMLFKEYLEKQVMENDLKIARDIQKALLPGEVPEIKGYDFAGMNLPAKHIGGDYFDIIRLNECKTAIVIADVSGKGTPASLLMANIQSAVHSYMKIYEENTFDIASVTAKINEMIYENTMPEKFITFFWGILDCRQNRLQYINAGHNPPFLFTGKGLQKLDKGGFMIGILDTGVEYEVGEALFETGDTLVLYTDGVTEAQDSNGNEYGEEKLEEVCRLHLKESSENIMKAINNSITCFTAGTAQYDDITLIVAKKS